MSQRLGQHWLTDPDSLEAVINASGIGQDDTALEIGPGLGSLTARLLQRADRLIAVELDAKLATDLKASFAGSKLEVVAGDILAFNPSQLPSDYKVAGNLPFYITAPILQHLIYSQNPPLQMGLLLQKEVAQRLNAQPGDLSVLAVSVQNRYQVEAGLVVPAYLFSPPPKVDSQIISLKRLAKAQFGSAEASVMKLVKAGFANRRKTLVNSLQATSQIIKSDIAKCLKKMRITENARAQELTLEQWRELYNQLYS